MFKQTLSSPGEPIIRSSVDIPSSPADSSRSFVSSMSDETQDTIYSANTSDTPLQVKGPCLNPSNSLSNNQESADYEALARKHADILKIRLKLAYYKVSTNQTKTPLMQLPIPTPRVQSSRAKPGQYKKQKSKSENKKLDFSKNKTPSSISKNTVNNFICSTLSLNRVKKSSIESRLNPPPKLVLPSKSSSKPPLSSIQHLQGQVRLSPISKLSKSLSFRGSPKPPSKLGSYPSVTAEGQEEKENKYSTKPNSSFQTPIKRKRTLISSPSLSSVNKRHSLPLNAIMASTPINESHNLHNPHFSSSDSSSNDNKSLNYQNRNMGSSSPNISSGSLHSSPSRQGTAASVGAAKCLLQLAFVQ